MKTKFQIDRAAMMNLGGGNVMDFCRRHDIDYNLLQHIMRKAYVRSGTKSQEIVRKLIEMGVGRYVNVPDAEAAEAKEETA